MIARRHTYIAIEGFDGVTSWHEGRSGIAYTFGDVNGALVAADESFRIARGWWFPDRHPATIALVEAKVENSPSYDVLDVTPEGGRPFQAWIDRSTHRLDRTIEQQAEDHVVTTYSDYRPVGGVTLPFTTRTGDGADPAFDEVETIEQVELNRDIPDSLFTVRPRPSSDIDLPPGRDSVELPFRLTLTNRIMVPITVNGSKTVEAEFDSGGSLILQPKTLAELGIVAQGRSKHRAVVKAQPPRQTAGWRRSRSATRRCTTSPSTAMRQILLSPRRRSSGWRPCNASSCASISTGR